MDPVFVIGAGIIALVSIVIVFADYVACRRRTTHKHI